MSIARQRDRYVRLHRFRRPVLLKRAMTDDKVPVLRGRPPDVARLAPGVTTELLLALYKEICTSWRELVGVRFKLLALVPAVSLLAIGAILSRTADNRYIPVAAAGLGLIASVALMIYDQRNSQLHDDLISRARRIEYELGVEVGQFRGRPGSGRIVKHDVAILMIYIASVLAWIAAIPLLLFGPVPSA